MPELPEIATMLKAFRPKIVGRRIVHVVAAGRSLLDEAATPELLRETLVGGRVVDAVRRGKYVRIDVAPESARRAKRKRPPAPGTSLVGRRPETLEELLPPPGPEEDFWTYGGRVDAARSAEKRGHSSPGTSLAPPPPIASAGRLASLVLHLRMTGRYFVMPDNGQLLPPRSRLVLALEGDEDDLLLGVKDVRRLARARLLVGEAAHRWPDDLALGPDALESRFDGAELARRLSGRRPIKLALLDQKRLAGVGNIYASEALHRARIHPARTAESLTGAEWNRLAKTIPELLRRSMTRWCALSRWVGPSVEGYGDFQGELSAYDRAGERCRRCRGTITTMVQAGRTTYFCPECQR
jgi:formamidopyrimidine-DNA glycosylase